MKERIEEKDVMFDTLEFLSLVEGNFTVAEVVLTCQDSETVYLLNIGQDKISLKKSGQEKSAQEEFSGQLATTAEWRRLKLGLANKNVTLECDGEPLLQNDFELGCTVGEISVDKGRFTRKCSPGTPTWVVETDSTLKLPLVQAEKGVRGSFTLFSLKPFKPSFSMKGAKVVLGLRGNSLVTNGNMEPLPAEPHDVLFEISSEGKRASLKVTKDGRVVHDTALEDSPKCMEVSGDEKFVLVQKLGLKAPRKEEASACTCDANGAENFTVWCLAGVLAVVSTSFLALVFHYCYSRICKNDDLVRGTVSTKNSEQKLSHRQSSFREESYPAYLEPVSVPVAQFRGGTITCGRALGSRSTITVPSSTVHLYEEIDETRLTAIGRPLSDSSTECTESERSSSGTEASH